MEEGSHAVRGTLITQGAEARVYKTTFGGRPAILKERFVKKYRHPVLDRKITTRRITQEARCLVRCHKIGVDTPCLYMIDYDNSRLFMEYVEGETVKSFLMRTPPEAPAVRELCVKIGQAVARMHDADIIHGDLTTSNMLLRGPGGVAAAGGGGGGSGGGGGAAAAGSDAGCGSASNQGLGVAGVSMDVDGSPDAGQNAARSSEGGGFGSSAVARAAPASDAGAGAGAGAPLDGRQGQTPGQSQYAGQHGGNGPPLQLIVIDLGLSSMSRVSEDKAVDLYVLERAFHSTHPNSQDMVKTVLESYMGVLRVKKQEVARKLAEVQSRGRKRTMVG